MTCHTARLPVRMRVIHPSGTSRVSRRSAIAAIAVVAAVACGPRSSPAGRGAAERVVSLAPAFTELLFAIGAGDRIVGRTTWCDTPPAALKIASVGDGIAPNVEAIVARNPDLVVLYASAANTAAGERLADLGVPTLTLLMDRLEQVPAAARTLGEALGVRTAADSLAAWFTKGLDSARAAPRPGTPPRVLILTWDRPPIVIGGGSFQHELLTLAGAENVFGDLPQPSTQVAIETIAARNPDLVVLLDGEANPAWAARPEWQVVPAVRQRRFVVVQGTEFARPTPRALAAVRRLRTLLDSVAP
jgi:iron complex transport system substrate-binding protein